MTNADAGTIDSRALRPGMVVGGKFVLLRQIGQGAVGAIFEAEDTWIGRRVALKVLHPHVARAPRRHAALPPRGARGGEHRPPQHRRRARGRAAARRHPYIVQELLDGISLRRHLGERGQLSRRGGARDPGADHGRARRRRTARTSSTATSSPRTSSWRARPRGETAGAQAHRLRHRRMQPQGELDDARGSLLGTPCTCRRSRPRARRRPTHRTRHLGGGRGDVRAALGPLPLRGAIGGAHRGEDPHRAGRRASRASCDVPAEVADVVHQALEREPARRFPSMQAFLHACSTTPGA